MLLSITIYFDLYSYFLILLSSYASDLIFDCVWSPCNLGSCWIVFIDSYIISLFWGVLIWNGSSEGLCMSIGLFSSWFSRLFRSVDLDLISCWIFNKLSSFEYEKSMVPAFPMLCLSILLCCRSWWSPTDVIGALYLLKYLSLI